MNIDEIICKLTLEEKFSLLTGKNKWETFDIKRLGIPSIRVSDGPNGVRKEYTDENGDIKTYKAVCFPTASALGATYNRELIYNVGQALGKEAIKLDVDILLGPGTNIKRMTNCGRNFEYFSEDPNLSGELAAAYINGVESQNVGTSLKHFACNNQEYARNSVSSEMDERTLREIYLKPFEIALKKSKPATVMCAYNRLFGIYCSENKYLLDDILRKEFGFKGIVVSDWWAVHDRAKSLKATLELQMPYTNESVYDLKKAYDGGKITNAQIDEALKRLLKFIFDAYEKRKKRKAEYDFESQHSLAGKAAAEAITLLKNEDNILPISKDKIKNIAVIGQYAKYPSIQGGGSACTEPAKVEGAYDRIAKLCSNDIKLSYSAGYSTWQPLTGVEDLGVTLSISEASDMAIVFVGNNSVLEGEAHDRESIKLPFQLESLILKVAEHNKNTVVVIEAGSAIDMSSWIDKVKAVVFSWLSGEAAGPSIADILFGKINPSGKLPETFPLCIEDTPAYKEYPGNGRTSMYTEGVMVGYRFYDTYNKDVLFPFGYGLSYTSFEYSDLKISQKYSKVTVKFNVKNTGCMQGKEVCQLYVGSILSKANRPLKELKDFSKISLNSGEEKEVSFTLNMDAFAYYSVPLKRWHVQTGDYIIYIGSSSCDIRLQNKIHVNGEEDFS